MNPLFELKRLGQSIWCDGLRRSLVTSGALKRATIDCAVSGVAASPDSLRHALSSTGEYDGDISRLKGQGLDDRAILSVLMADDAAQAAEVLDEAFKASEGADGLVVTGVDIAGAGDAASIAAAARRVAKSVGMANVLVALQASAEGLVAAEELVFEGVGVCVGPVFSADRCADAAWAYVRGLERRAAAGMPLAAVSGAVSVCVSRVDTFFDGVLESRAMKARGNDERARLRELIGKVGAANASLACARRNEVFSSARFKKLKDAGALVQRLVFASVGSKNPQHTDIKYVSELVHADTASVMPVHTMLAFRDHGKAVPANKDEIDGARKVLEGLEGLGVDFAAGASRLDSDAARALAASFDGAARAVGARREAVSEGAGPSGVFSLGPSEADVSEAVEAAHRDNFLERLWAKDATLWKNGPEEKRLIRNSLGWVALPYMMDEYVEEIEGFAGEIRAAGFRHVVLLGMGGSSLAPLVFATTFGRAPGAPGLVVLDSTDPEAIASVAGRIELGKALFIVSSKSGSTIEPLSLFEYFHDLLAAEKGAEEAGRHFAAITDPGTPLEGFCRKYRFRKVFINHKDIGGRFSALSFFGLVPAALMGVDISRLLDSAATVAAAIAPCAGGAQNQVVRLGAALGRLGAAGRDKLTFLLPQEIASFGMWIEQLVAESTGKEGRGLVPLSGEPLCEPGSYGADRVFISVAVGRQDKAVSERLKALADAGHPVIELRLDDVYGLGGEFLRWEAATAVAGRVLGINPFDQPDVELAKKLAISRLGQAGEGEVTPPGVEVAAPGFGLYVGAAAAGRMGLGASCGGQEALRGFMGLLKKGDYIGLMAYFDPSSEAVDKAFAGLRAELLEKTGAATQFGYGPRYLHSTGQLHKGRPERGLFLIFCHRPGADFKVPGSAFSFSRLILSQAFGDMEALDSKGANVALVYVDGPDLSSLEGCVSFIKGAAFS